jgi:hypothetical protein
MTLGALFLIDIPFLSSNGFRLNSRPHEGYFFELNINFHIKSSPKTLKLVNISRERAKNLYGSYPTEFVFGVKNEN